MLHLPKHSHTPLLVKLVWPEDAQLSAYPVLLKDGGEVGGVDTRQEHFSGHFVLPGNFFLVTIRNLNEEELWCSLENYRSNRPEF